MQAYLPDQHIAAIETGCPVSALGSEMPRQSPEVRRAATMHIKEMIDLIARQLPGWGQQPAHEQAMALLCASIGTMIARAADDTALSEALRAATMASSTACAAGAALSLSTSNWHAAAIVPTPNRRDRGTAHRSLPTRRKV